jgi:hypothetical protein
LLIKQQEQLFQKNKIRELTLILTRMSSHSLKRGKAKEEEEKGDLEEEEEEEEEEEDEGGLWQFLFFFCCSGEARW